MCYVGFMFVYVYGLFYQFIFYIWQRCFGSYSIQQSTVAKSNAIMNMNKRRENNTENQMSSPMVSYNVYTYGFKIDTTYILKCDIYVQIIDFSVNFLCYTFAIHLSVSVHSKSNCLYSLNCNFVYTCFDFLSLFFNVVSFFLKLMPSLSLTLHYSVTGRLCTIISIHQMKPNTKGNKT